jgi:hypothetical protein
MAGILCVASSGAQAIGAATAETVLHLLAANNHRIKITGYSVTVAGTSPIDLTMRVLRQSSAGTAGTTSGLITKLDSDAAGTIQTAGSTAFSAEPSAGDVLQYKKLNGGYEKYFPMGQEIIVPEDGRIGIECTSTTAATVAAEFYFEE